MEKKLKEDLISLAIDVELHPERYNMIRLRNLITHFKTTSLFAILPVEILCLICEFLFDTVNLYDIFMHRLEMMAFLQKTNYKYCLNNMYDKINMRFVQFSQIQYMYTKIKPMMNQCFMSTEKLSRRDLFVVINNRINFDHDITDRKQLGNYITFMSSGMKKQKFIEMYTFFTRNSFLNFHLAAQRAHCGGKKYTSPFKDTDSISIQLNDDTKRLVWLIDSNPLHSIPLQYI